MLISFGAMAYLKSVYARNSKVPIASGLTGAQAAARILQSAGITDVEIVEGQGFLGDHYDPLNKKLVLSPENYEGSSAANVGVAAHECGHALQHQQHYAPLQIRMGAVYATNFASNAVFYVMMASMFFHLLSAHVATVADFPLLRRSHCVQPDHAAGRVRCQRARQGRSPEAGDRASGSRGGGGQFDAERGRADLCGGLDRHYSQFLYYWMLLLANRRN